LFDCNHEDQKFYRKKKKKKKIISFPCAYERCQKHVFFSVSVIFFKNVQLYHNIFNIIYIVANSLLLWWLISHSMIICIEFLIVFIILLLFFFFFFFSFFFFFFFFWLPPKEFRNWITGKAIYFLWESYATIQVIFEKKMRRFF
jgi:hypothetical protein